jgi:uncharacterized protein YidB (DUF937 family)
MDLSSLLQLGASVIRGNSDKTTTGIPLDKLGSALSGLLGGQNGKPDLGALLSNLQTGGLGEIAASWLGKGANQAVSPDALSGVIGIDKIKEFAAQLGISEVSAKNAVADALPVMFDKASPDGSLLGDLAGNFGGLSGMLDSAKKLF